MEDVRVRARVIDVTLRAVLEDFDAVDAALDGSVGSWCQGGILDRDAVLSRADVECPEQAEGSVGCEDDFGSPSSEAVEESRFGIS